VFGFSDNEVSKAQAILSAWQNGLKQGQGVVELDGQLIENLHAEEAERVVIFAHALARRTSA
jgi:citrate lyase subunit beta/citryl-CoA lyase